MTGTLEDKEQIERLVNEAARAIGASTIERLATAVLMKGVTLRAQINREGLTAGTVRALRKVIETGKPLTKDLNAEHWEHCRTRLDSLYEALRDDERGRFTDDLLLWVGERHRKIVAARIREGRRHA